MEMLQLAIKSGLPLIYVRTDDVINVEEVLNYITDPTGVEKVRPIQLPAEIKSTKDLAVPAGRVFYTGAECKQLPKLYRWCVDNELTIVFINTEKSVLQFDGGVLIPPRELVLSFLSEISADPEGLLPSFGGMTLKDVGEVSKMTMTRDESLTSRGINTTRRGYNNLRGIQQVDTELDYYVCPSYLETWMEHNAQFFISGKHEALTPRGLLLDGPPGTGKTLASKYIANAFGVPLYRMDLGAMMGKYVGESEASLNAALAQLDQVEPAVVVLDEVEKVFKSQSDSGVTSRLLSQLLWWLQEKKSRVFVVMTTNDMKSIPEELHREGRIDGTMQFMGIETFDDGYTFAKGAFEVTMQNVGIKIKPAFFADLNKRVKSLFNDDMAVPQTKLTKVAYDLVRELTAEEVKNGV